MKESEEDNRSRYVRPRPASEDLGPLKGGSEKIDETPVFNSYGRELKINRENAPTVSEKYFSKRPLLESFKRSVKIGFQNWYRNLDPRGKDLIWFSGVTVGFTETVLFTTLAPIPGGSMVRAGVNLALASAGHLAVDKYFNWRAREIEKDAVLAKAIDLYNQSYIDHRSDLEENRKLVNARLKNFFLGVSAGATYMSAISIASGVTQHLVGKSFEQFYSEKISEIGIFNKDASAVLPQKPPVPVTAPPEVPADNIADGLNDNLPKDYLSSPDALKSLAQDLAQNHNPLPGEIDASQIEDVLKNTAVAEVTNHADQIDKIVNEAFAQSMINPEHVSPVALESAHSFVQHHFESYANDAVIQAAQSTPGSDSALFLAKVEYNFIVDMNTNYGYLVDQVSQLTDNSLAVDNGLVNNVNGVLKAGGDVFQPGLATEVAVKNGNTVGQLLIDHGSNDIWSYPNDIWDFQNADVLGGHVAANYDLLNDTWFNIEGVHLPFSMSELSDIIEKAKAGDMEALQKLKDALRWIPADQKFKILSDNGIKAILQNIHVN